MAGSTDLLYRLLLLLVVQYCQTQGLVLRHIFRILPPTMEVQRCQMAGATDPLYRFLLLLVVQGSQRQGLVLDISYIF